MGEAPDWYVLMRVAKWLGVAPWELGRQTVGWYRMSVAAMAYEGQKATHDRGD